MFEATVSYPPKHFLLEDLSLRDDRAHIIGPGIYPQIFS